MTVGPRGLVTQRLFSAAAIALGLALYAAGATTRLVRDRVRLGKHLGHSAHDEWVTARRWLRALQFGGLLPGVGPVVEVNARRRAELAVLALSARAPDRSSPLEEQVFRAAS
jgi:hypothetical protein